MVFVSDEKPYSLAGLPESLSYAVGRLAVMPSVPPAAAITALDVVAEALALQGITRDQLWRAMREATMDSLPAPEGTDQALGSLVNAGDLSGPVRTLYQRPLETQLYSTGWPQLDRLYKVAPGQWTLVTGVPNHGKSSVVDALALNLMRRDDWKIAVYSAENLPVERHLARFMEKWCGKRFWPGASDRLGPLHVAGGIDWFADHLTFLKPAQDPPTLDTILRLGEWAAKVGCRGLVIDPWNELLHERPAWMSETEYISGALGQLGRFAKRLQMHVWLVAHPQKLYRGKDGSYPVPTPYDVSGSAHFRNKADNCLCVYRQQRDTPSPTEVYVQKIRFAEVGEIGMAELTYHPQSGGFR